MSTITTAGGKLSAKPVAGSPRVTRERGEAFALEDVLAISKIHPFYNPDILYPPNPDAIQTALDWAVKKTGETALKAQPLLWKKGLYTVIQRLIEDPSPQNTFRRSVYTSTTGGGSGYGRLFFATDVHENRKHRALFGRFLRTIGLVNEMDCVVTVHSGGDLYRSLDLTLELLENAGATVLAAGHHMSHGSVIQLVKQYRANVLSGDSSQIVAIVHYVSTLSQEEQATFEINKVIYTSESMTKGQRAHILTVLGPHVQICSLLGSAEGGPYAASCARFSGDDNIKDHSSTIEEYQDFIVDDRITRIEILPTSIPENDPSHLFTLVPDGKPGMIAQTSLTRLRNPLVRYITGDIGSLHKLPTGSEVGLPAQDQKHLFILRLYGRDRRFSFEWGGEYYEFRSLAAFLNDARLGILQWQLVMEKATGSEEALLQLRLLRPDRDQDEDCISLDELKRQVGKSFSLCAANEDRFQLLFVRCLQDFELSPGGRKVVKFIDRFH